MNWLKLNNYRFQLDLLMELLCRVRPTIFICLRCSLLHCILDVMRMDRKCTLKSACLWVNNVLHQTQRDRLVHKLLPNWGMILTKFSSAIYAVLREKKTRPMSLYADLTGAKPAAKSFIFFGDRNLKKCKTCSNGRIFHPFPTTLYFGVIIELFLELTCKLQ